MHSKESRRWIHRSRRLSCQVRRRAGPDGERPVELTSMYSRWSGHVRWCEVGFQRGDSHISTPTVQQVDDTHLGPTPLTGRLDRPFGCDFSGSAAHYEAVGGSSGCYLPLLCSCRVVEAFRQRIRPAMSRGVVGPSRPSRTSRSTLGCDFSASATRQEVVRGSMGCS